MFDVSALRIPLILAAEFKACHATRPIILVYYLWCIQLTSRMTLTVGKLVPCVALLVMIAVCAVALMLQVLRNAIKRPNFPLAVELTLANSTISGKYATVFLCNSWAIPFQSLHISIPSFFVLYPLRDVVIEYCIKNGELKTLTIWIYSSIVSKLSILSQLGLSWSLFMQHLYQIIYLLNIIKFIIMLLQQ